VIWVVCMTLSKEVFQLSRLVKHTVRAQRQTAPPHVVRGIVSQDQHVLRLAALLTSPQHGEPRPLLQEKVNDRQLPNVLVLLKH